MITIRAARLEDVERMAEVQHAIYEAGLRSRDANPDSIRQTYFEPEHSISLTVAERDQVVVGFQSLKLAWPGNPYDVTPGWGVIGTHLQPDAFRQGIGRRLFEVTLRAARDAGLEHVDATIGSDNPGALAYYAAMGFAPYCGGDSAIPHRLDVTSAP